MGFLIYLILAGAGIFMMYYLPMIAKDFQEAKNQNTKIISLLEEINSKLPEDK